MFFSLPNIRYPFACAVLLTAMMFASCRSVHVSGRISRIDTLFSDKISIRAITIADDKLWYGADKGRYGYVDLKSKKRREANAASDSVRGEFRSIASTGGRVLIANAGSPAKIFMVAPDLSRKLVHLDAHPDAFFDSMQFITPLHGILLGDPVDGCFTILQSFDGGISWNRLPCTAPVKNIDGEAAFAASNGNIAFSGSDIWIFTGGKSSRVLKSPDLGKTWRSHSTPMVSGRSMTGTFAGDFYDFKNGIIVGGDYENQGNAKGNKAVTQDGGMRWKLVSDGAGFGYASAVKYVPGGDARQAVAAGPGGVFMTTDGGSTWEKILADGDIYTLLFANRKTMFAAGKGKVIKISLR